MNSFSHLDAQGQAHMVDVGDKPIQSRWATAAGCLTCSPETIRQLREEALPKGDVLGVARLAGILAAKKTAEWIPLCHSLPLNQVSVDFQVEADRIVISATARTSAKTGVEMEALTAVSAAALTLYDMMKSADKNMVIGDIRVIEKRKQ